MHILIVGASGTVGGAVARIRSARRVPARALLRSPAKAASLPPGITANFQAENETSQGLAGVEAAEWRAG